MTGPPPHHGALGGRGGIQTQALPRLLASLDFQAYLFPAGHILPRRAPDCEPLCEEM